MVGGAIDYVKQLEQQLVALQAAAAERSGVGVVATAATAASDGVFVSPQYTSYSEARGGSGVDVEATAAVGARAGARCRQAVDRAARAPSPPWRTSASPCCTSPSPPSDMTPSSTASTSRSKQRQLFITFYCMFPRFFKPTFDLPQKVAIF